MPRIFTRTITTPAAARQARPGTRPVVSFVTDFGMRDPSAGLLRAVVLGVAPDALIIDISHEVAPFRVRDGALVLWSAIPYLPVGAHVAVVDPGVGTDRRAIALETARGDFLVGPDNGILLPAAARLGGITRAHLIVAQQYRLPVVSASFHGRDLFAPAAAHLATGTPIDFLGPAVDPSRLLVVDWPEAEVYGGVLRSQAIYLDLFGNVKLSALGPELRAALGQVLFGETLWLRITDAAGVRDLPVTWAETFGNVPPGTPLLYEDSYGRLCLAVNQGSAAALAGVVEDSEIVVTRAQLPVADAGWGGPPPAYVPAPMPMPMPGPGPAREPAPAPAPAWEPAPAPAWEPAPAPAWEPAPAP
ncbi:MAG: S-adenosyl-l-methionine hydroxide adenosyltransferase family protein, partial [Chloroflexota bacterium]